MGEILGNAKTVRELLKGVKYSIDYYQREYKWQEKQIRELVDDLCGKFLGDYLPEHSRRKVAEYAHYFLGSIIISRKGGDNFIVDGQQRLTSLTLFLILLRNLQKDLPDDVKVALDDLIYSQQYGEKSFNIEVDDRVPCMKALFEGMPFDPNGSVESVQSLYQRYQDLEEAFPDEIRGTALPYFTDWLLENVHLVEITAYSDEDAYTIFETMNDRGLSLSATEMLKGYLLAKIDEPDRRATANTTWRNRVRELNEAGKEVESDFFKAWLRSQYSTKIRERTKGAKPEDFDRIGTEFHRWLGDVSQAIGLNQSDDYFNFIDRNFDFYSRVYLHLVDASQQLVPGLEHVLYIADHGFTLQNMLFLAPVTPDDNQETVRMKQRLVARYLDILLAWRFWNFRSTAYSTMQYAMFVVMREIRGLDVQSLAVRLHERLTDRDVETFTNTSSYHRPGIGLSMHQQNRSALHRLLARLTDFIEVASGGHSHYDEYVTSSGKNRFEVEHVWADKPGRHRDEFQDSYEFDSHRNRFGGLLLLPKSFNAAYGDLAYEKKLPHYDSQNLLARSLHPNCYERNPGFMRFVRESGLPFRPHEQFKKADLDERCELYRRIAELVWNPEDLLREAGL